MCSETCFNINQDKSQENEGTCQIQDEGTNHKMEELVPGTTGQWWELMCYYNRCFCEKYRSNPDNSTFPCLEGSNRRIFFLFCLYHVAASQNCTKKMYITTFKWLLKQRFSYKKKSEN